MTSRNRLWPFGPVRIPPLPQAIVMTDRLTGTMYVLTHDGDIGALSFLLSDTLPTTPDYVTYGPYEGPYLTAPNMTTYRLYVSDGALMAETADRVYTQRVVTRRAFDGSGIEVTIDNSAALNYNEIDFVSL